MITRLPYTEDLLVFYNNYDKLDDYLDVANKIRENVMNNEKLVEQIKCELNDYDTIKDTVWKECVTKFSLKILNPNDWNEFRIISDPLFQLDVFNMIFSELRGVNMDLKSVYDCIDFNNPARVLHDLLKKRTPKNIQGLLKLDKRHLVLLNALKEKHI